MKLFSPSAVLALSAASLALLAGQPVEKPVFDVAEDGQIAAIYKDTTRPNLWALVPAGLAGWMAYRGIASGDKDDSPSASPVKRKVGSKAGSADVAANVDEAADDSDLAPPIAATAWEPTLTAAIAEAVPESEPVEDAEPGLPAFTPEPTAPIVNGQYIASRYGETIWEMLDTDVPTHNAVLAKTQMGKTTTLQSFCAAVKEFASNAEIYISDLKYEHWPLFVSGVCYPGMGVMKIQPQRVLGLLAKIFDRMERRSRGEESTDAPIFLILDEWNSTFSTLKKYDKLNKTDYAVVAESFFNDLVLMGLGRRIFITIVGQETNCDKLGFSSDGRDNFSWYALARGHNREMVSKLFQSGSKLIAAAATRKAIESKFDTAWKSGKRDLSIPIVVGASTGRVEYVPNFSALIDSLDMRTDWPQGGFWFEPEADGADDLGDIAIAPPPVI